MANGDAVSPEPVSYRSEGTGEGWGCGDFCPFGGVGGVREFVVGDPWGKELEEGGVFVLVFLWGG